MYKGISYSRIPILNYDDEDGYVHKSVVIYEEKTDEPIGNFTGLFDKDGRPLFRPKERIGFKTWK